MAKGQPTPEEKVILTLLRKVKMKVNRMALSQREMNAELRERLGELEAGVCELLTLDTKEVMRAKKKAKDFIMATGEQPQ